MKLLYIANIRIPTEKAHGIQIMKMCEAFSNNRIKVKLIIPRRINNIFDDPFEYYSVERNFEIVKIPTIDFGSTRVGFWLQTITFSICAGLYALFHQSYIMYSRDELLFYFLSFILPKNLCWEVHTNRYNIIVSKVARSCLCVITISGGLRNFFISKGIEEERIVVAHDGVNISDFNFGKETKSTIRARLNIPRNRIVLAYIGKYKTMSKDKGIDSLIKVFPEIKKKNPLAFLLIVGINKNELLNIKSVFNKSMIDSDDYKIVLHIPHHRVIPYLVLSDIMIMNYPNIEHYALYMSPLKMFEYMASKNIIVASKLPSIEEILNDKNCVFCEPDNPESFLSAINFVFDNTLEVSYRAQNAFVDVKNYSWHNRSVIIVKALNDQRNRLNKISCVV